MPPPDVEYCESVENNGQASPIEAVATAVTALRDTKGEALMDISSKESISEDLVTDLSGPDTLPKLKLIARMASPVVMSFTLYNMTGFVIMFYAGQLSAKAGEPTIFAGISMSTMFANVSCFSILIGMTSAVETLASQNNGAKNYREVGLVLQRSIFILSLMLVPIVVLWLFVEDIFLYLGTDAGVCAVMGKYLRVRLATMPVDVVSKSYEKYLACIGLTNPAFYSQTAAVISTISLGWLFLHHFGWGYESLGWAFVLSTYMSFIVLFLSSYFHPFVQRTLQPLSVEALSNLQEFVYLGFPGLAMLCSEWWAYEALTLFASQLGPDAVAAQTIIITLATTAYMVPMGISVASTTLVGNAIGGRDIPLAKQMSRICVYCGIFCEVIVCFLILYFGKSFIELFSVNEQILLICERTIPILAVFHFFDGFSSVFSGIARGAGKQNLGAYVNIPSYYLVALPLAYYFCFYTSYGVIGLILGISVAPVLVDLCLFYFIFIRSGYVFSVSDYAPVSTDSTKADKQDGVELVATDYDLGHNEV